MATPDPFDIGGNVKEITRQIAKSIRWLVSKILHYIRVGVSYLIRFARIFVRYLGKTYEQFMKDPIRFMEFAGSMGILIYYGLL